MTLSMWEEMYVRRVFSRLSSDEVRYTVRETETHRMQMIACTCEECTNDYAD